MLEIPQESDWERCHTPTFEPYFYDQSYTQVKCDAPICIDRKGIHYIAEKIGQRKEESGRPKKWKCTSECKVLTVEEHCKSQSYLSGQASGKLWRMSIVAVFTGNIASLWK